MNNLKAISIIIYKESVLLLSTEVENNMASEEAALEDVKKRLNTEGKIIFSLDKEFGSENPYYYIHVNEISQGEEELKWLEFSQSTTFSRDEIEILNRLKSQCYLNDYRPVWFRSLNEALYNYEEAQESYIKKFKKDIDSNQSDKIKITTIFFAFIIGIVFDIFFYEKTYGISYPIFIIVLIGFYIYTTRDRIHLLKSTYLLFVPIILLSITFCIHSNTFLLGINFVTIPILLSAFFIINIEKKVGKDLKQLITNILGKAIPETIENMPKPFVFIFKIIKGVNASSKKNPVKKSILIGLVITLPLLLFILPLLVSADMAFKYYIENAANIFSFIDVSTIIPHIIIVVLVSTYIFGYLWSFKYPIKEKNINISKDKIGLVDSVSIGTVLIIINLVYLMFTVVQASYLYGGVASNLPTNLTYAEYARKGFFELITVTVINLLIFLIAIKVEKNKNKIINILYTILTLFSVNMLYSAHYKLSLYEITFGYTYLRIYVDMFMLLLLLLFIIVLIKIWYDKLELFKTSFSIAMLMLIILNYMNVDKIIVSRNIDRFNTSGIIDTAYLKNLSYDAVPGIIKFSNGQNGVIKDQLISGLKERLGNSRSNYSWMEFNYSRYNGEKLIKDLK